VFFASSLRNHTENGHRAKHEKTSASEVNFSSTVCLEENKFAA
jgi:hypothetical protein